MDQVAAGPGIQVTSSGGSRTVSAIFAGSGGSLGTEETVARSDHGHPQLATATALDAHRGSGDHDGRYLLLGASIPWEDVQGAPNVEVLVQAAVASALPDAVVAALPGAMEQALPDAVEEELARQAEVRGDCPEGYTQRGPDGNGFTCCGKDLGEGLVDEVVRVGDFWIDRYEASLWDGHALQLTTREVVDDEQCTWSPDTGASIGCLGDPSDNGFGVTGIAVSAAGRRVLHSVTWFQAQSLCVNAGKRLCTNAQWQAAALGTPDPAGNGHDDPCNVNDHVLPAAAQADQGWASNDSERHLSATAIG